MAVTTSKTNKPILPRGADVRPIDSYNRAELYSGKALDFDGVNDVLTIPAALTSSLSTTTITHVLNFKTDFSSFASTRNEVFTYAERGVIFTFNNGTIYIFYRHNLGNWGNFTIPNDKVKLQEWNHCAIVIDYDNNLGKAYINGQEVASQSGLTGASIDYNSNALTIGGEGSARFFNGQIAGFKIFNTALTAAQVADLYNNPEKVVPTGLESNLKLWLPMMEGAGTTAINGAPDALQDEEVTNGDFATDSDWTKGTGWSISGGLASSDGSQGATSGLTSATISGLNNKGSLLLEVVVDSVTAGTLYATLQGTGGLDILNISSAGTYKVLCETGDANAQITLGASADFVGSVSSVSLKELANCGSISGATWTQGIGAAVAQTAVINWNKGNYLNVGGTITEILVPQGLTSGRDLLGNLFENVRKQGALNLDGNSWAGVHDNESHDLSTAVTLEFWCKVPQIETFYTPQLIGKRDQYDSNWLRMYKRANGDMVLEGIGGANLTTSTPDNTWTHFVATLDGASAIIYKNGTSAATGSLSWTMVDRAPIGIGGWLYALDSVANANSLVNGQIAQPRIYNRALTASEVKNNYEVQSETYFTGLLESYSGAAAAYSLRLLDSTYTGPAVRARRSTDNAEQDISFSKLGLDTVALENFVNSGEAFTDSDITSSSAWTKGANTTYNAATEALDLLNENGLTARQGVCVSGHTYAITIVLDSVTSGGVKVYAGGTQSAVISTAGTHTLEITASNSNNILGVNPSGLTACSISRFSAIDTTADAFVTTWYDQSGNDRNVTKSTASSQPQIVSIGSTITHNGKPAIEFGTPHTIKLEYIENYLLSSNNSLFASVYKPSALSNYNVFDSNENDKFLFQSASGQYIFNNGAARDLSKTPEQNQILALLDFNGSILKSYFDGSNTSTHTGLSSEKRDGLTIGGHRSNDGTNGFIGKYQELVYWDSNNSDNVSGIQTNINNFYDIY